MWEPFAGVYHTGEDWNHLSGANSDWGDDLFATAHGVVTAAGNYGPGWGNIIMIRHEFPTEDGIAIPVRSSNRIVETVDQRIPCLTERKSCSQAHHQDEHHKNQNTKHRL